MRKRLFARALVPVVIAVSAISLAPPAHAATSCSVASNIMTVLADDASVQIAADTGNFFAGTVGGNLCPVRAISTLVRVDLFASSAVENLTLHVGSNLGYGPAAGGRDFLPTRIIGGTGDLRVRINGGSADDSIRSFAQAPGALGPWGIDLNFTVDEDVIGQDEAHIFLDMAPQLTIAPGAGTNTTEPGPGRPESISSNLGVDTVSFVHYQSVYADLDGGVDDGGEGDGLDPDIDRIIGSPGADTLVGGIHDEQLEGAGGNDVLIGRGGADNLRGGLGDDSLHGGEGDDTLGADEGNDRIFGGAGDDQGFGGEGADRLEGGLGDDNLFGQGGADTLIAGATADGSDLLKGGDAVDTVSYAGRAAGVRVTLDNRANDGAADEFDDVAEVESVIGGRGADVLVGDALPNRLDGGPGNDVIFGLGGNDSLLGRAGSDQFIEKLDTGNDVLSGGSGVDTATYAGRAARVVVRLDSAANDGIAGETDNVKTDVENVVGTSHADVLAGSAAANTLSGGSGNDSLTGGLGKDRLFGGAGNDTLSARDGVADGLSGGSGTDRARVDRLDRRSSIEALF